MFDHMEIPLHHGFGTSDYWRARRSMRYNSELYGIASEYRSKFLNSNDLDDGTWQPEDWRLEVVCKIYSETQYIFPKFKKFMRFHVTFFRILEFSFV